LEDLEVEGDARIEGNDDNDLRRKTRSSMNSEIHDFNDSNENAPALGRSGNRGQWSRLHTRSFRTKRRGLWAPSPLRKQNQSHEGNIGVIPNAFERQQPLVGLVARENQDSSEFSGNLFGEFDVDLILSRTPIEESVSRE